MRSARVGATRALWWSTFVVVGVTLLLWSWSVPRLGGSDEHVHVIKAVAVAHGDLTTETERVTTPAGAAIPMTWVETPAAYGTMKLLRQINCWSGQTGVATSCAAALDAEPGPTIDNATYVGTYQPAYYAAVGWPSRVAAPVRALQGARALSAAAVAALVASAIVAAVRLRSPLMVAGLCLGLTPGVLFIGSVVSPSGVEIAAAAALWSSLLLVVREPSGPRRDVVRAAVAAACLASSRPLSPVFVLVIVGVVLLAEGNPTRLRDLWRRRSVRFAVGGVGGVLALNAAYLAATDALGSVIATPPVGDGTTTGAARHAVGELDGWLADQVRLISWSGFNELHAPSAITAMWAAIVVGLLIAAVVVGTARRRVALAVLVAGALVGPIVAQALRPEVQWQGRYTIPLSMGVAIVAGWTIDRSGRVPAAATGWVLTAVAASVALAGFVAQQALMSRNLHGFPAPVFAGRDPELWTGPLTPNILFAAGVALVVAWVALSRVWAAAATAGTGPARDERGPVFADRPPPSNPWSG